MYSTNQRGLITELQCQLAFGEVGIVLYQPITPDSKIDYIADINHKLYKIQCRSASVSEQKDFIQITCIASGYHNPTRYTADDVDFYYTYYNGKSYLIPFFEGKTKNLRLAPPANNNLNNITWAKDFEFETVLQSLNYQIQTVEPTIIASTRKTNVCAMCGTSINANSIYCSKCIHIVQQKTERPEREELKEMIRNQSFVDIGKKYNVSDNAIRKWCIAENLPSTKKEINSYSNEDWSKI